MSRDVRKPDFCICENKAADQLSVTAQLICGFVFATQIVQSLYFLNRKFQASIDLLLLHSLVCVGPGLNPRRPVFSRRGSHNNALLSSSSINYHDHFMKTRSGLTTSHPPWTGSIAHVLSPNYHAFSVDLVGS